MTLIFFSGDMGYISDIINHTMKGTELIGTKDLGVLTRSARIIGGVDLLQRLLHDFQLDPDDPGYLGYVNVGKDHFLDETDSRVFCFICDNPQIFMPIIEALGGGIEGDRLDEDETVFFRA
jgi:hypothetical protein